jgi:hypothetical protein
LSSSSRLPLKSVAKADNPVMFPPGRARLATRPVSTGLPEDTMTIGTVVVVFLAAWAATLENATMTSI